MSVAVVVPSLDVGGCEFYAADLASELNRAVPTSLICQSEIQEDLAQSASPTVPVVGVGPEQSGPAFAAALRGYLSSAPPQRLVVVIPLPAEEAGTTPDPVAVLEMSDSLGLPTTAIFQLCHRQFDVAVTARSAAGRLSQSQRWVTVSHHNQAHLARTFDVPVERLAVIPNGVPTKHPDTTKPSRTLAAELGLPRGTFVVLSVGRLVASKRHVDAVDAMAQVADNVHLVIAGAGPERNDLAHHIDASGLNGRVSLLGHRKDIPVLLTGADAFAFPSVVEGASFALLEAMGAGLPVVASRFGSNAEIVRDGIDGYLHDPASPSELAAKLSALVTDPALAAKLGGSARRRVERYYDRETMLRDTLALILDSRAKSEEEWG